MATGIEGLPRAQAAKVLAPLAIYLLIAIILFKTPDNWRSFIFGEGGDPLLYVWVLHWWPFAISHGLNPFVTHYVWAPAGQNLAWTTSLPTLSLLGFPFTWAFGAVVTFNILALAALPLAGWTAFLLAWEVCDDWAAALLAGFLFGFSGYETGQLLGHLNLDFVCFIPLAVWLFIRRQRNKMGRGFYVCAMAATALAELGIATEVLASAILFASLTWAGLMLAMPECRGRLLRGAVETILAGVVAMVLATPFFVFLVRGLNQVPGVFNSPLTFSADLLNFVVPTNLVWAGGKSLAALSGRFTGNSAEQGAYLGLPLIFILAAYARRNGATRQGIGLFIALCVPALFSLGQTLQVGGTQTHLQLPWALALHVPVIRSALPVRFALYTALAACLIAALWMALPGHRKTRLTVGLAACLFQLPAPGSHPWCAWPAALFFSPANISRVLGKSANVLILPFGEFGPGMAWQLDSAMEFTQTGGYLGPYPKQEDMNPLLYELQTGNLSPNFHTELATYCASHRVDFILIAAGTPLPVRQQVQQQGWPAFADNGVLVIRPVQPR